MSRMFSKWWSSTARVTCSRRPLDDLNTILPYCDELEDIAGKYNVWRRSHDETTAQLARRAGLAICEAIELKAREIKNLEADLDIVLGFER
jgi:hypothetical protein